MKHSIDLAFEVEDTEHWMEGNDTIQRLADEFKGEVVSAGTGFGCRDMQIEFPTKSAAKKFRKAVQARTALSFQYVSFMRQ